MTGKLLKENILTETAVGQGSTQTAAETAVMLSGGDRNVKLVHVRVQPTVNTTEVQTGGVAVQGVVDFDALYLTDGGEMRSRSAQTGFTAVIPVEEASPKGRAKVLVSVTGANGSEQDGRLELAADLHLEGFVSEGVNRAVATGVQANEDMAQKTVALSILQIAAREQAREAFAENFPLDDEQYTRVVLFEARVQVDSVQALDGAVEVSGSVTVDSLLAGADASAPVGWQSETIPFMLEIANDAFRSGMQVSVTARVRDLNSEVVFNIDGEEEEGNLHIEYVLELTAEAQESSATEVLADAYPLSDTPFQAALANMDYIETIEEAEQTQTVETTVELPSDVPQIQQLVGAFAAPLALDAVGEDAARAEGLMRITLLYRAPGQEGLVSYEQETPFAVTFDRISGLSQVYRVKIGDVEAQRISPAQAQVRVKVEMEALRVLTANAQMLDDVAFEGDSVQLPVGAVLYYPESQETTWDVARRYRIPEESLLVRNPEGKAPLLIYRRLTSF